MLGERGPCGGNRLVLALATAACVLAATVAVAVADDATETSTFGKDGIATQSLGIHFNETQFSSVEARPDGGLVAQRGDQLESYLPNGAPDPASPPLRASPYRKVFPLAGGKSLLAGESSLTRVNADGSIDPTFGGTGTIKVPGSVQAAAELPSGKILLAKATSGGTHEIINTVTVGLVNPDGGIDQSFGAKGFLSLSLPSSPPIGEVVGVALSGEGGALVVGGSFLLELQADGSPNPGFGSAGLLTGLPTLVGARVLADGSIEAVGSGPGPTGEDLLVLGYTAAGGPLPGFGDEGRRTIDLGGEEQARAASWATDGSVVVGGSSIEAGPCRKDQTCAGAPIVAAFDPGGGLDPSFADGGVLRLTSLAGTPPSWFHGVAALTRRSDGSIVAAGGAPPSGTVAFLAAFSPEGALLPGFGDGGIVRIRQPVPAIQSVAGLARLASGKLLAAGTTDAGTDYAPVLIRYGADGALDRSFGAGAGYVNLGGSHFARGFAVNASAQALVGVYEYPRSRLLLRAADGAPVPSFGADGAVQLPRRVRIEALGFDESGGAIVVGSHDFAGDTEPGVVLRFHPNGKPASGFGHDGRVVLRPRGGGEMRARALDAGARGRMLVGGIVGRRFAMTRLLPDGRPDPRFGSGGWSLASAGGVATSVTLRRVGSRIYLAGIASNGDRLRVVLLRFGEDGRLDPTFGRHGRRTAAIAKSAQPKAIVPSHGGVLVVLSRGARPLLSFGRDGRVRRHWVGSRPRFVADVRATRSGGRLVLGWNAFSGAIRRDVYYLARSRSAR
jgi:uncharacterized delta-60 repeat protein